MSEEVKYIWIADRKVEKAVVVKETAKQLIIKSGWYERRVSRDLLGVRLFWTEAEAVARIVEKAEAWVREARRILERDEQFLAKAQQQLAELTATNESRNNGDN